MGLAVNVLHFSASDPAVPPVAAIKTAYQSLTNILPTNVTITVPGTGDTIDDTTGELTGVWSTAGGGSFVGAGTAVSAAGVGACVGWQTGGIVGGKKLRGRTFIVPLHNATYEGDGTLSPSTLSALDTFGSQLRAAGPLAVWHRPTTKGGTDGNSYGVIAHRVRDKVAYLSSRRD